MRSGFEIHRLLGRIGLVVLAAGALAGCGADADLAEEIPGPRIHALDVDAGAGIESVWTLAGTMHTPRKAHTATRLPGGRVLVTGGYSTTSSGLSDAEEYEPKTNTWTAVGPMHTRRLRHTATLLPDGKVLVSGGYKGGPDGNETVPTSDAEIYDPDSQTFTKDSPMSIPRGYHTATLLTDGRVLVTGGFGPTTPSGYNILNTAEVYDPTMHIWMAVGPMHDKRGAHIASLLLDGRVLVACGFEGSIPLATAEVYDPAMQTFTPVSAMEEPRHRVDAVRLSDGRVMVAGVSAPAEIYDPEMDAWSRTGSITPQATGPALTTLPGGLVLGTGGTRAKQTDPLKNAEVYDPLLDAWPAVGSMTDGRTQHTTTLLLDGRVLVAGGGGDAPGSAFDSAELFRLKPGGEACSMAVQCQSGACTEGVCGKLGGEACNGPDDCRSLICTEGVCSCTSVHDCASPLACDLSHQCGPRREDTLETGCSAVGTGGGGAERWAVGLGLMLLTAIAARRRGGATYKL